MITLIVTFFVVWCLVGTTLYVNAMINWGRIYNPYKRFLFGFISGPLIWLFVVMFSIFDLFFDSVYTRIRNWFLT